MKELTPVGPSPTDEEIEMFYLDNAEIIRLLLSTVNAVAYDPSESAQVWSVMRSTFGLERGGADPRSPKLQSWVCSDKTD